MKRLHYLKFIFALFALVVIGKAALINLLPDSRLRKLADRQFNSKVLALPRRGLVFDRNGEGLAISLKVRSLFFRPELVKKEMSHSERIRVAHNIARTLGMSYQQILSKISSERSFVWVKRQLSETEEQALKNQAVLDYGDGIGLVEETKRFYPNKELASHVLGSVGVDGQGLEGLELFYDGILHGERIKISSDKDAMGRRIFRDDQGLQAFKDGQSLVLTLDKAIQFEAERVLKNAIHDFQAKAGTILLAEVETGEILALANYPSFNSNNPKIYSLDARRNRAITDTYEPGSVFKPFILGMALEKGKSPKSKVYCEKGSFKVGDRRITEAETHEKFEWLTLGEILKFSSNIGAAKIALELGPTNVGSLVERIGINHKTNIDLPGEVSGTADLEQMKSPVRLSNIGFGHGITVTPIQMLSYYLAIANGGRWIQPKIVKAILSEDPDSLERGAIRWKLGHRFDTIKTKKIFSQTISHELIQMLEGVVQEKGTGTQAQLEDWTVAGKTGTAQKIDPKTRRYSREKYISSFAGFAPSQDPKVVGLVILDEPTTKYYAGETAAPVFRDIMQYSLLKLRVPPNNAQNRILQLANRTSLQRIEASTIAEKPHAEPKTSQDAVNTGPTIKLPNLRGLSMREVVQRLNNMPVEPEFIGSGILKEQIPPAEQLLEPGTKVRLIFDYK